MSLLDISLKKLYSFNNSFTHLKSHPTKILGASSVSGIEGEGWIELLPIFILGDNMLIKCHHYTWQSWKPSWIVLKRKSISGRETARAMHWKYGRYTVHSGLSYSLMTFSEGKRKRGGWGTTCCAKDPKRQTKKSGFEWRVLEFYFKKSDLYFKQSLWTWSERVRSVRKLLLC